MTFSHQGMIYTTKLLSALNVLLLNSGSELTNDDRMVSMSDLVECRSLGPSCGIIAEAMNTGLAYSDSIACRWPRYSRDLSLL